MRVCLDATPLLGQRTGVGRYTEHLLRHLVGTDLELSATAFTWRGLDRLASVLPSGVAASGRRAPARALQSMWARGEFPTVQALGCSCDVFHATNFVLPPHRSAGVVTVHDLSYLHHSETVDATSLRYRELVPRSLRRAAVVCTPTAHVASLLKEAYGLSDDRVEVTPLGVDDEWHSARPDRGHLPESYLLFVGTIEPRKNLPTLLAAHALLPDAPPLVVVGARGWGDRLQVGANVIETGYLELERLRGVVAGSSALVMPSVDEGFGLPALEAMATGVPVVVSDIPTFREVLGEHARYAPVTDAEGLAAAISATLDDPGSAEARRAHAQTYSWQRTAQLTRAAYGRAGSSIGVGSGVP